MCCTLCAGSRVNHTCILVRRPLGVFVARWLRLRPSGLVLSGVDGFVRGTWRPPSFVEKLLSEKRDQGNCGDLAQPWRRVKKSPGRDLIAGKRYS